MRKLSQIITFSGTVIHGDKYGRTIGFPTANITTDQFLTLDPLPNPGVYGGMVEIDDGSKFIAGIVIMNQGKGYKVEAHLLDFDGDLYGQELIFKLESYIREYINFENEKELKEQVQRDLEDVKNF